MGKIVNNKLRELIELTAAAHQLLFKRKSFNFNNLAGPVESRFDQFYQIRHRTWKWPRISVFLFLL